MSLLFISPTELILVTKIKPNKYNLLSEYFIAQMTSSWD